MSLQWVIAQVSAATPAAIAVLAGAVEVLLPLAFVILLVRVIRQGRNVLLNGIAWCFGYVGASAGIYLLINRVPSVSAAATGRLAYVADVSLAMLGVQTILILAGGIGVTAVALFPRRSRQPERVVPRPASGRYPGK